MDSRELIAAVREPLRELAAWLGEHQGDLLGAAALIVGGWLLAVLLRSVVRRLFLALGRLVPERFLRQGPVRPGLEQKLAPIAGHIVFWIVILIFFAAAAQILGLPLLSATLGSIKAYVPRLIGTALIIAAGLVIANLGREAATAAAASAGSSYAAVIGQIVRAAVLLTTGLLAVAELGIDITLLTALLSITLLAVLGAFSLAFGLGARDAVRDIIGLHYIRQTFAIGQRIRIGEREGTITAFSATSVIIDSPGGQLVIPATLFTETIAIRVMPGGDE
ncbi:MAG TPA: mechanosensitive ion channel domain-containing protein [Thermoanaerobaculia bacterium]